MFGMIRKQSKILYAIILTVAVKVMDYFFWFQVSAKKFFHNKAMLSDIFSLSSTFGGKGMIRRINKNIPFFVSLFSTFPIRRLLAFAVFCRTAFRTTKAFIGNIIFKMLSADWAFFHEKLGFVSAVMQNAGTLFRTAYSLKSQIEREGFAANNTVFDGAFRWIRIIRLSMRIWFADSVFHRAGVGAVLLFYPRKNFELIPTANADVRFLCSSHSRIPFFSMIIRKHILFTREIYK